MKKIIFAFIAAASVSAAFAEAAKIQGSISTDDCPVLGEAIQIGLSNKVHGAFNCSVELNAINVGACHESGSRSTTLQCAVIGTDNTKNPAEPIYNHNDCATPGKTSIELTAASFKGFRASTTGGSVGQQSLSAACTTDAPAAQLVNFN